MRYGPFVFLGLLGALSLSWFGMVATPQLQLGNQQPTNVPPTGVTYPIPYPGVAALGREVYRANGCAYCHTQVVRQEGNRFDVVLSNPGTNQPAVIEALMKIRPGLSAPEAENIITAPPAIFPFTGKHKAAADALQKALADSGAQVNVRTVPIGADIGRGWGTRMTVSRDYVYHQPLLLGSARIGPDLANVGIRRADENWHLMHLYNPRSVVPESSMPKYSFLFEERPRGRQPSPIALPIPGNVEVVPTREARALVAYLLSLRAELPLFEAPAPPIGVGPGPTATNQPAALAPEPNAAPGLTNSNETTNQAAQP
jgi:cbb3-type cytochrome oxidase cytochrome c subunit